MTADQVLTLGQKAMSINMYDKGSTCGYRNFSCSDSRNNFGVNEKAPDYGKIQDLFLAPIRAIRIKGKK